GEPVGGAIAGLLIWSAYLLILTWLSTKTMNSVAGFVFDQATGGLRRLVGAVAAAFTVGNSSSEQQPEPQANLRDTLRQEIRTALSTAEVRSLIEAQLQTLQTVPAPSVQTASPEPAPPPEVFWQPLTNYVAEANAKSLTPKRLDRKLQKLLTEAETHLSATTSLPILPLQSLEIELEQREDLSERKKQRILTQIETAWADANDALAAASPASPRETSRETPIDTSDIDTSDIDTSQSESAGLPQELLQKALEMAVKQALPALPKLLAKGVGQGGEASLPYGLGLASLALANSLPDDLPSAAELLQDLPLNLPLEALEQVDLKQALETVRHKTQSSLVDMGQGSLEQLEHLQSLALKPVEIVQQGVQEQVSSLKQQASDQVEATRRAAAKAAWWLFATAATGGASAVGAGALAALLQASQGIS
ncbi:MAG TPA: hypothetical protein V6D06_21205, partial [Trichocoleus sp.]